MARLRALVAAAWIAAGALALWLWIGVGFPNYDTLYALVWGQQLSRGETPTYDLPIAPTPHPLMELVGLVLAPLGPGTTTTIVIVIAYLALAALAYLVWRIGADWFNAAAGAFAAALIITREPVLSYGVRAYVDVPYVALVLGALLVESRRRRAGAPVLWLLAVAGLLRPEAWVLSGLYWLYLLADGRSRAELARLALIVVSAPVLWALSDLLITGNVLWSVTKTHDTAATLRRSTGVAHVPVTGSRRIGEVLRPDGLIAAALGGLLCLWLLRARSLLGAVTGVVAVAALTIIAIPGLPIDTRYVFLPVAILAVFAGAGAFGWRELEPGARGRRLWQAAAVLIGIGVIVLIPSQRSRLDRTFDALSYQQRVQDDLIALIRPGAISLRCGPVGVPNHAPVPLVALHLRTDPRNVVSEEQTVISHGTYVSPARREVEEKYVLDPHDPRTVEPQIPPGFHLVAQNRSWRIYASC